MVVVTLGDRALLLSLFGHRALQACQSKTISLPAPRVHLPAIGAAWMEKLTQENGGGLDNEFGFKVLGTSFLIILGAMGLFFIYEGMADFGVSIIFTGTFYFVALKNNASKQTIVYLAKAFCRAWLVLRVETELHTETHFRRAMFIRAMMNLVFFESLEESFLDLLTTSVIVAGKPGALAYHYALPLQMFFFCNLPLRILGISEWISLLATQQTAQLRAFKSKRFLSGMHFFSTLVPTCLVHWTSSGRAFSTFYWWQSLLCFGVAAGFAWLGAEGWTALLVPTWF